MSHNLFFDFTVDRENNTLHITREFAAELDLVWDAWTKAEILDQWFAPKPFRLHTKELDFREGGRWLYAMINEDKVLGWSLAEYQKIVLLSFFTTRNSFSDEYGNHNSTDYTFSITDTIFRANGEKTTVQVIKKMEDLAQLEKFASSGFRQGMEMNMKNLDELLEKLKGKN